MQLQKLVGIVALCAIIPACSNRSIPPSVGAKPKELDTTGLVSPCFEDVTNASGIDFSYRNGDEAGHLTLLETLGGGIGLIDYDRDGLLDIFVTGGGYFDDKTIRGHPSRLYRNLGKWRFQDVTAQVGLDRPLFYSHGCAVGDYDNDGWPDLFVTGYGAFCLYRNDRGKFVDVTAKSGLSYAGPPLTKGGAEAGWSTSAAWGDLDGDGFLDLYVTHYVDWSFENHPRCPGYVPHQPVAICSPRAFKAMPDALYFNNGKGGFRDVSRESGLQPGGKGLGVLLADLDEDGKLDVYVANDTTANFLYLNKAGRFQEAGFSRGVAYDGQGVAQGSMGVDAADYDGSGRFSLFVTNFQNEAHALYRNLGRGQFHFASPAAGITAIGFSYVGFGAGFVDFDRDGAEDLLFVNGHITQHPPPPSEYKQRPVLLRNLRTSSPSVIRFQDVSAQAGPFFDVKRIGRGVAFGDLDNDGRTDVVVSHNNEPAVLLRNVADNGHHWLGVALVGKPNEDAVGALLTLEFEGRKLVRQVKGGGSYLSASDTRVLFGLDTAGAIDKLSVHWPSGKTQTWERLAIDRYWTLLEGQADAEEFPRPRQ